MLSNKPKDACGSRERFADDGKWAMMRLGLFGATVVRIGKGNDNERTLWNEKVLALADGNGV